MPTPLSNNPPAFPLDSLRHWAMLLRQLTRAELSAMVTLSALAGYLFAGHGWRSSGLLVASGIWLLAAGGSALNQWQEQDLDARMERTRLRPLPSGSLTRNTVLRLSLGMLGAGLLLLTATGGKALLLGLLAVIWYNGIYTPLKRRTPFAALPGAVCGALPPLIGWAATGTTLLEPKILTLSGTLFLWQIPHTWLLLCRYPQDLRRSGLPDLFATIPPERLMRIHCCCLIGLAFGYLLFPLFGMIAAPLLANAYLVFSAALGVAIARSRTSSNRRFHLLNLSMALLLLVLVVDGLLG